MDLTTKVRFKIFLENYLKIFQISGGRGIVCVIGGNTDQLVQHCLRYIDNLNSGNL
ncbi:hypothetical protein HID58_043251, partial [Brassica napus]